MAVAGAQPCRHGRAQGGHLRIFQEGVAGEAEPPIPQRAGPGRDGVGGGLTRQPATPPDAPAQAALARHQQPRHGVGGRRVRPPTHHPHQGGQQGAGRGIPAQGRAVEEGTALGQQAQAGRGARPHRRLLARAPGGKGGGGSQQGLQRAHLPQPGTGEAGVGIGRIGHRTQPRRRAGGGQPRWRHVQQGPQQQGLGRHGERRHAREPTRATPTKGTEGDGLGLVARVVAQQQMDGAGRVAGLQQRRPPRGPGAFLQARAARQGQRQHPRRDAVFRQLRRDAGRLGGAFRSQPMVHDEGHRLPASPAMGEPGQRQRIRPARAGDGDGKDEGAERRHPRGEFRRADGLGRGRQRQPARWRAAAACSESGGRRFGNWLRKSFSVSQASRRLFSAVKELARPSSASGARGPVRART